MKSEQMFLSSLLDFSNIPSKRATDYPHHHAVSINNHATSLNQQINKSLTHERQKTPNQSNDHNPLKHSDIDFSNNNQKLLKAFNTLRDKLNSFTRENTSLKETLAASEQQLTEQKQRQSYHLSQIAQLSKKLFHSEQELTQYKIRLNAIKHSMQQTESRTEELQKNRINIQHLIQQNKRLKEEIQLSIQISIQQKLQLEQQLQQLKLKEIHETRSTEEAQNQLYRKTSDLIRLENQFKKLKLLYDEQNFMKNINSESIILQKQNQSLKLLAQELDSKLKKQKNKKYELEGKLLELEEKVRLYGTKTDIYEGELSTIVKKIHQVQKDNVKAQNQANSALNQKLSWEEKFYQSTIILEELINRVKRELMGDAVELAKTCEFRLNKLKNGETLDFAKKPLTSQTKRTKSSSKKVRAQSSNKKVEPELSQPEKLNIELNKLVSFSNSHSNDFKLSHQNEDQRTILKERTHQNSISKENNNLSGIKKKLFNEQTTAYKPSEPFSKSKASEPFSRSEGQKPIFGISQHPKAHASPMNEMNLQAKIRKEREVMEKKLREKILYHKIEDATSSPVKNKLRQQYFNLNGIDFNQ